MNIITLDFETFFNADYTFTSMTTEQYVRDPRFEVHGCGVRTPDGKTVWYDDAQFYEWQQSVGWQEYAVLCHHTHFDGLILSHHYGIKPTFYLDTLSMARLLLGNHIKKGLGDLAKHFGLGAKDVPYDLFKGKHWHELSPQVQRQVADGCCQDVELTWRLFNELAKSFPAGEYAFVDATVRMFCDPVLVGDTPLLGEIWQKEAQTKQALLTKLGVTAADLRKQWRFAEILRSEDIEPEQKPGKPAKCKRCLGEKEIGVEGRFVTCPDCNGEGTIPRWNYSFAKTDEFMRELLDDETPLATIPEATVSMLAHAKLDAHSTGTQTRVERMGHMSTRGPLCVYLNYAGTHLSGWSGGDKMNWQNFRRGGPLAGAVRAPVGHMVVVADASQIECRLLECVAGEDLTDWRAGKDPYTTLASKFYEEEIYKPAKDDPRRFEMEEKRGTGKQLRLSCLGPDTLVLTDSGTKPITDVQLTDRVWDGIEWVSHQGLLSRGTRTVIRAGDLSVTPDHGVLCGPMWSCAQNLLDERTLSLSLLTASATLLSPDIRSEIEGVCIKLSCGVTAELQNIGSITGISNLDAPRVAMRALNKLLESGSSSGTGTQTFALINHIGDAFFLVLLPFSLDVKAVKIVTMGGEVYEFIPRGDGELLVDERFWPILSPWRVGMIRFLRLIGETTIWGTSREIYDSQQTRRTQETDEQLQVSNWKLTVYDLAYCGPRNRFTVVSGAGPLIVHNCGYGAGDKTIIATARKGVYGPPVYLTPEQGLQARDLYRGEKQQVVGLWNQGGDVLKKLHASMEFDWTVVHIKDRMMWLPNGVPLRYDTIEWHETEEKWGWRVRNRNGWSWLYGAKFVENLIQALRNTFIRGVWQACIDAGLPVVSNEHDKLYCIAQAHEASEALKFLQAEMSRPPAWLPDVPLSSEGFVSETFAKEK